MTTIADKIAASKIEPTKTKKVFKSFSRSGFQFGNGFIRPDVLNTITPKNAEEQKYIEEVLLKAGKVYIEEVGE